MTEMLCVMMFKLFQPTQTEKGNNILLVVLELRPHPVALVHPPLPARENEWNRIKSVLNMKL